ncbi:MAG: hypothetical protein HY430_03210 [Candidatus Levybacteria bacterium]|nr:hypothetical protein [Candidatus Levybacteria bacterium]
MSHLLKQLFLHKKKDISQEGQVLLIVILIMVVTLSIGLSVISRSITNQRISKEQESSQRAFSAAEAGVEQALKGNTISSPQNLGNNATIEQVKLSTVGNSVDFVYNNSNPIPKDDGVDVWLSTYPNFSAPQWTGTLTVFWGNTSETCDPDPAVNTQAAIEVVVLSGPSTAPVATHYAYDPCTLRKNANQFNDAVLGSGTVDGKAFAHSANITIAAGSPGLLARIIPLYASAPIAVRGTSNLPSQGSVIESVGSSGGTKRKITVYKGHPKIPTEFFPYLVLAP